MQSLCNEQDFLSSGETDPSLEAVADECIKIRACMSSQLVHAATQVLQLNFATAAKKNSLKAVAVKCIEVGAGLLLS